MKAQEAREKSTINHKKNNENQYGFAKDSIKQSVDRGEFKCICEYHMDKSVTDKLEDEGYIVFKNIIGTRTTISWNNSTIIIKSL